MGSMTKLIENMEILIHGNIALKFLTTCQLEQSSMEKLSVFMED